MRWINKAKSKTKTELGWMPNILLISSKLIVADCFIKNKLLFNNHDVNMI